MQKVRWGIVGAGRIAHSFAQDMGYVPNAELAAVAARNGSNAIEFAGQYDVEHAFEGYQPLFDSDLVDAVYIATPHNLHFAQVIAALGAGKAVLCEKPLVVSPDECRELNQFAHSSGRYLMEGMWTYFLPAVRRARQWVDEGRIGKVRHVKADFGYPLPYDPDRREYDSRLAGGCLLEMGIYPVALAQLFLDGAPESLQVHSHMAPNGVEDDVIVVGEYPGAWATLATSFRCKLQNWAYIIGEDGYIAIPDFWRASECSLFQLDTLVERFSDDRPGLGFNFEIEAVSADIIAGRTQSGVVTPADSLAFQETMARIRVQFAGALD